MQITDSQQCLLSHLKTFHELFIVLSDSKNHCHGCDKKCTLTALSYFKSRTRSNEIMQ